MTLASKELHFPYAQYSLSFDSPDTEILQALQPVILEEEGLNILESDEETFTVKKVESSKNTFIFPKSVAGNLFS